MLPRLTARLAAMHADERLFAREVLRDADLAELGRFAVTLDPRDVAAFKTPGLRNVALTWPYMHDGSVPTLADAIELELYRRGAGDDRPIILPPVSATIWWRSCGHCRRRLMCESPPRGISG